VQRDIMGGFMLGLMQDRPLLISSLLEHAETHHGNAEIVSKTVAGAVHRYSWRELGSRARRAANALQALGVRRGTVVATLAWNTYRHLELYYAVSGMGAILHTINPRLFSEQIEYIANHAEDHILLFDTTFAERVVELAPRLKTIKHYIALADAADIPVMQLDGVMSYERLLQAARPEFKWPSFDERTAAALCYTSGTTGNPKGVLYTHRSTLLHAWSGSQRDVFGIGASSTYLLLVPMFHANAWGLVYNAPMTGAKLVLPGPHLDGQTLYELMRTERVTETCGVPTLWVALFEYVDRIGVDPRRELVLRQVLIGGSAAPRAMIQRFDEQFGVQVLHAWGMTETSPIGVVCRLLPKHDELSADERYDIMAKQGRAIFGVDLRVVDDNGKPLPHDGKSIGRLKVRGPWVVSRYFKNEGGDILDAEGFFDTGDIAHIDSDGYLTLVDRTKDVIKSGGEWISSIDLENAAVGCTGIQEAAVIGIPHPHWQERPLLVCVRKPDSEVTREMVLECLKERVVKWWLPDDVVFVDALPHTATGKLSKLQLRERFKDYRLPPQGSDEPTKPKDDGAPPEASTTAEDEK
jgi:fatty-acyl-CoA synthase